MIHFPKLKSFRHALFMIWALSGIQQVLQAEESGPKLLAFKVNGETVAHYSRTEIESLEAWGELETETPWTDQSTRYEGIPFRTLIPPETPLDGKEVRLLARNGYLIEVPLSTILKGDGFLAFKADGKWMRLRDKGPVWLIFPFSQHPELNDGEYRRIAVWMLEEIDVFDP
jgi:hypothetical protein